MKPEVVSGLENATWPVLLLNPAGTVMLANPAAKTIFGAALSASLASIWAAENGGLPEALALWLRAPATTQVLKYKNSGGAVATLTTAICQYSHNGEKALMLQLLPGGGGGEVVPEAKSATEGDAALKQKLDCVLQLARTVSLDFNNALTGVLAHTSLLLGKAEANHPWRRSLLEVEKSAARAAEIASELALFSRQEKESRRAPAGNLNQLVTRCVEFFRTAQGAKFSWSQNLERSLFESRFEEAKVQQALTKILENAVESFSASAMSGQISVQTRNVELTQATQDRNVRLAAGAYVCVEITDTGTGIEAESLPRIFEPFFTTKKAPHRGLGLALVYGIISNHGGGVAISSMPGKGTSARVYLPAEKSRIHDSSGNADTGLRGTATVLVVDDESILLTMSETILTEFGYKVLTANNGQKALQVLAQPGNRVDLIITDLVMPGMGGRELIEKVRQQGLNVPILCTSGYVLPEDKQAASGYLQKPFTSTDLLRKVKAALEG
ncbi:MAG TPA: ATP-binding protein [Verrucomicrobiae bacterium]|nr:ATP-binding protein [Verrucomicrobiae bacterium]